MNKEIKDRLDKLENELKESKNEIHSLKSSVSLTIERGIGKLLSRFTRKQLILGSVIALFLISIIGIAGTVTKTYTFSSGEVVSASKFNTNFDTLFTLVNGNLDDNNISGISGSKITSGTIDGARIDNVSASVITGALENSSIPKPADSIVFYSTPPNFKGNLGGRTGADQICKNYLDNESISMFNNSCSNVRALISVDSNDEIRDMVSNYNVPTNRALRGPTGLKFGTSWDNLTNGSWDYRLDVIIGAYQAGSDETKKPWGGSTTGGALDSIHCSNFTSNSGEGRTLSSQNIYGPNFFGGTNANCNGKRTLYCICF